MDAVGTGNVTQLLTWRRKPSAGGRGMMTVALGPLRERMVGQLGKPTHASSGRKAEELTGPTQEILPGPSKVQGPGPV